MSYCQRQQFSRYAKGLKVVLNDSSLDDTIENGVKISSGAL